MEMETTAGACPARVRGAWNSTLSMAFAVGWRVGLAVVLLAAWIVSGGNVYTANSRFGYWLGVVGGSLMLALLVYPLRKRFRALSVLGPLKHWFRFHLVAGMVGPAIILFHTTFAVGSFNAGFALVSMLLVVASGIVGRYLYRKIHHGLYGSRANAEEMHGAMRRQLDTLAPMLDRLPAVAAEVDRFSSLVTRCPVGFWSGALHFVSLGWKRMSAGRRIRRAIDAYKRLNPKGGALAYVQVSALVESIEDALRAAQRSAQFATYESLFGFWHVIHIPFLCLMVGTAVVHVVAVHAY